MKPLRIVFAGTPLFAQAHLKALINSPYKVVAVYTQPDKPAGRGKKSQSSAVKKLSQNYNIPVYQPSTLKSPEAAAIFKALDADIMVVVAYGMILPIQILTIPRYGCINVHASLLPRWRGAAPIQRAIAAGDKKSGITIMQMDQGLDTGAILMMESCAIYQTDTTGVLHDRLLKIGCSLLIKFLENINIFSINPQAQNHNLACYAYKIDKKESIINWNKTITAVDCHIRAFTPQPGAKIQFKKQFIKVCAAVPLEIAHHHVPGTILHVTPEGIDIACQQGALRITHLQLPSARSISVKDFLNSKPHFFPLGFCLDLDSKNNA